MAAPNYKPRSSTYEFDISELAITTTLNPDVQCPAPTPVLPVATASPRPIPKPRVRTQGLELLMPQSQPSIPPAPVILPAQPQAMPPPYYLTQNSTFQQPYPVHDSSKQQAQEIKTSNEASDDYQIKFKAGCIFCTMWKGALEITIRITIIVVALIFFALSSFIINKIDTNPYFDKILADESTSETVTSVQILIRSSRSVAGFMIFMAIVTIIIESSTIFGRFCLRSGVKLLSILHIVDAIACVFLALFFLCGASPSASYSSQWSEPPYLCQDDQFTTSYSCEEDILTALLAVLSVLGFVDLALTVFLTLWIIMAVLTKWDHATNGLDDSEDNNAESRSQNDNENLA